jgi:uncharacterized protein YqjF (DUF2071 family)
MRHRPRGPALLRQRWCNLAFLHWAVDPAAIASLLPPGLEVDTWDGRAYVGIVPFSTRGSRVAFLPPVPGTTSFDEVNVRTYVHRHGRDPGVFFFSLDASSRLAVWGARATYRLPYFHAAMAAELNTDGVMSFSSRRSVAGGAVAFASTYRSTSSALSVLPGTLDFFLIERYLLYSWDGRFLRRARVWHAPYPTTTAEIGQLSETLTTAAGIAAAPDVAPLAHYSAGVDVRIYAPTLIRERNAPRFKWSSSLEGQNLPAAVVA